MTLRDEKLAVWVITPNGLEVAGRIAEHLGAVDPFVAASVDDVPSTLAAVRFQRLSDALNQRFDRYHGHIFIMATGIVVRLIAGLIRHKSKDPAVVVVDDKARHAVSLLSGHIGGANRLTHRVAHATGARPVITTATDVNQVPAVDTIAVECGLQIENPQAVKPVNMAWLTGRTVGLYDPYGMLRPALATTLIEPLDARPAGADRLAIVVDDVAAVTGPSTLVLRPKVLAVGIGCNRNTPTGEMQEFLTAVLQRHRLSVDSVSCLATIDVKSDEDGLIQLAAGLGVPLRCFNRRELRSVEGVSCSSPIVEKHVGVKNVCEAAAILAAGKGELIVAKQIAPNVTLAVARTASSSSVSGPATRTTCPQGP